MKSIVDSLAVVTLIAWCHLPVAAQTQSVDGNRKTASGAFAEGPPTVDGRLDDDAWQTAPIIAGFIQHEPRGGEPATNNTEVRVLFDGEAVYVGAWMYDDEPDRIVLGETRRDADLTDTDAIRILFDTYLDRQNAFVFGTTPAGIEYDGQVTKEGQGGFGAGGPRQQAGSGGGVNLNWDGSWDVATSVDEAGWYAEFRIPFSTLRYGSGGTQVWGFNVARNVRRLNEQSFWAPIPRQHTFYRISQAGDLTGIEAPVQRTVAITPFVLSSAHRDFVSETSSDFDADIGGDAKVGLTPSLALDLTYNTDFAQVEVDEAQINLTRFPLFFPEKRPFFLENAGTFSVGTPQDVELFFSRRIGIDESRAEVPILGGGRLSGKIGPATIGVLNIQTDNVDSTIAPNNYSVARIAQELPNRSRLGGIVVSRVNTDSSGDYNLTYGIDGRIGIGEAVTVDGYYSRTQTPDLFGGEHAFSMNGGLATRDWQATAAFAEVGENFNPEVGFLPRSAYRFVSARILRHIRLPGISALREIRPHVSYREFFDLDGFSETRLIHIDQHFAFSNGAFFQFPALNFTREGLKDPFEIADGIVIPPGTYDNFEFVWRYNTNEGAAVSVSGILEVGGFYSGNRVGWTSTITTRLGGKFAGSLRFSYADVNLDEGDFETVLTGLRVAYSFTPRIYLQSLIQYDNQSDSFSGNVRFGWLNTAGTGLFIVFNQVERTIRPRRVLDRALIVKFTRQFQLVL